MATSLPKTPVSGGGDNGNGPAAGLSVAAAVERVRQLMPSIQLEVPGWAQRLVKAQLPSLAVLFGRDSFDVFANQLKKELPQ